MHFAYQKEAVYNQLQLFDYFKYARS
jgi:hypothetical protein